MVPLEKLKLIMPEHVVLEMSSAMEKFSINTILRVSHFIAQVRHESANFTAVIENLNYSEHGLMKIFPKYFPTQDMAKAYARQPEKIANRVYGGRLGNGDEASGDGYRFRGRGFLQTTGRSNYKLLSDAMKDPLLLTTPDLVSTKKYACLSAGYFWNKNNLNSIADTGSTEDVVKRITKVINGGTNGLQDRLDNFNIIYKKLSDNKNEALSVNQ